MSRRRPRIADILVATLLLMSSTEVGGNDDVTDCRSKLRDWTTFCGDVTAAPACILSKNTPSLAQELPNITTLTASVLAKVPGVHRLFISSDSLTTVGSSAFANYPQLQDLTMYVPNVTALEPGVFRSLPKLDFLHLKSGIWSMDEAQVETRTQLRTVILEGSLQDTRPGTSSGNSLLGLRLAGNNWTHFPDCLTIANPELRSLLLPDNGIQTISAGAFGNVLKLQTLDLSRNQITSLPPETFARTVSLLDIQLSSNKLTSFPKDLFAAATNLTNLWLGSNQLETLDPGVFRHNPRLAYLDLSNNTIKTLPADAFAGARGLRRLLLSRNRLALLPADVLRPAAALSWLDLSRNLLQELPEALLAHCPQLWLLWLDGNQLKTLPGRLFDNNAHLSSVFLTENNLSSLPAELFSGTPALRQVWLSRNPWNCSSCDVSAMAAWLRSRSIQTGYPEPRCWGRDMELRQLGAEAEVGAGAARGRDPQRRPHPLQSPPTPSRGVATSTAQDEEYRRLITRPWHTVGVEERPLNAAIFTVIRRQ